MNERTLKQRVDICRIKANLQLKELAEKLDTTSTTLNVRMKTGKFSKREMCTLASAMGIEYHGYFLIDGIKFDGDNYSEVIREIAEYRKTSLAEIARQVGMKPANFINRLSREKYKVEDLEEIAVLLGGKFVDEFYFPDGTVY